MIPQQGSHCQVRTLLLCEDWATSTRHRSAGQTALMWATPICPDHPIVLELPQRAKLCSSCEEIGVDPGGSLPQPTTPIPSLPDIESRRAVFVGSPRAHLVTLSACQTGVGQSWGGEVLGLAQAFSAVGTSTLAVSRWRREDGNTARLMQDFCRGPVQGEMVAQTLGDDPVFPGGGITGLDAVR